jgi:hypothetical protein
VTRPRTVTLILVAVTVVTGTASAAAAPTIKVSPNRAYRGEVVRVFGSVAGGCMAGDQVTLTSRVFNPAHEFAGVPAVFARVRSDGSYSKRTRLPRRRKPGRYSISGRCGGGNLGVTARLRILVARRCGRYDYDGPGPADERSFIAIRTRRVTCRGAKRLMRRVSVAGDACPARWRCVYPLTGRAKWTQGLKRITFAPAG